MAPSVLPQFQNPTDPVSVYVANPPLNVGATMRKSTSDAANNGVLVTAGNMVLPNARKVFSMVMTNPSATDYFLQFYDKAASPGAGSTPVGSVSCPAGSIQFFDFPSGYPLLVGLFVTNSTTQSTLTAGGADCLFAVSYSE